MVTIDATKKNQIALRKTADANVLRLPIEDEHKEHERTGDACEVNKDTIDDENNTENRNEHICNNM